MAGVRNAFSIRAADAATVETTQFLHLYSPILLNQLQRDDLFVPKMVIVRGSPGCGKSSLLRLFELETLFAAHERRRAKSDEELVEGLESLGALTERGPRVVGMYIQCDSILRDVKHVPQVGDSPRLFNALLDTRIVGAFVRGLRKLQATGIIPRGALRLLAIAPEESPPALFASPATLDELEARCAATERAFGELLNSFPGDPLPEAVQPHARIFALQFLAIQFRDVQELQHFIPLVMLDDVQDLSQDQRALVRDEFLRRVSVPRWLAVRTQVYGLEELISVEGKDPDREFRDVRLDEVFQSGGLFSRFAANVVHRRLQSTEALQQVTVEDFKRLMRSPDETVPAEAARPLLDELVQRTGGLAQLPYFSELIQKARSALTRTPIDFSVLVDLQVGLILSARYSTRGQRALFPTLEEPEAPNAKLRDAAEWFATKQCGRPFYHGFETFVQCATGNVQQLLATLAGVVERMVHRAELDRDKSLKPEDQEKILRDVSADYYRALEAKHRRGASLRQFVENLGRLCADVTYKPNAPIAPGVSGFGLTPGELREYVQKQNEDTALFREVLTAAVAGNVLSVRPTKQGQAGTEKLVFYLNRVLCVQYELPPNYGGWQHIPCSTLLQMMRRRMAPREIGKRGRSSEALFNGEG